MSPSNLMNMYMLAVGVVTASVFDVVLAHVGGIPGVPLVLGNVETRVQNVEAVSLRRKLEHIHPKPRKRSVQLSPPGEKSQKDESNVDGPCGSKAGTTCATGYCCSPEVYHPCLGNKSRTLTV